MPERDLALLSDAAREAGRIALRYWQNQPRVWTKADESPVTEADHAVNDMLRARLCAARPHYGWLSEETPDDAARLDCPDVFIVDPIDGTRAFIAGERHFAHSLAIARDGRVTAAAVYLPALDRLYLATADGPALADGEPIRASGKALSEGVDVLTSRPSLDPEHWQDVPQFKRSFRASLAYRLCLVADGSFDAMLTFRDAWEWDTAAGALIAERAGAVVTDGRGGALRYNSVGAQSAGLFAAAPPLHRDLVARMKK